MRFGTALFSILALSFVLWSAAYGEEPVGSTGLKPHTPEQLDFIRHNWRRVKAVRPNQRGLERINSQLRDRGLAPLTLNAASLDEEVTTTVGELGVPSAGAGDAFGALPVSVDNSSTGTSSGGPSYCPPVANQGSVNSCTAFSTTYYQLTCETGLARGLNNQSSTENGFSPKFVYNQINRGLDDGSSLTDAYQLLQFHGAPLWSSFPTDDNYLAWDLNPSDWQTAISYRPNAVQFIEHVSTSGLAQTKQLLANGHVLVVGTFAYSWQFGTVGNDPSTSDDNPFAGQKIIRWVNGINGGHAITLVGYDDEIWVDLNGNGIVDPGEKGAFLMVNSWGTSWGNGGYMWIAYDALLTTSLVSGWVGATSTSRVPFLAGDMAYSMTARASYTPKLLGRFTLTSSNRNTFGVSLGASPVGYSSPTTMWSGNGSALGHQGGALSFSGGTSPVSATFVFDLTDIASTSTEAYFLALSDTSGTPASLSAFEVIDPATGSEIGSSTPLPIKGNGTAAVTFNPSQINYPPTASIVVSSTSGDAPFAVTFDGTPSSDRDGSVVAFSWNFGDGTTATGAKATHGFPIGSYTVTLTVTDNKGATADASTTITALDPNAVAAPTNLIVRRGQGSNNLHWRDNSNNETGFRVERSVNGQPFQRIATTNANIIGYADICGSGSYAYRVKAVNRSTDETSAYTNQVAITVP